jgi:putative membrane protein
MMTVRFKVEILLVGMLIATPALSLSQESRPGIDEWTWPPLIVIPLALAATLYSVGTVKMLRRARNSAPHRRSIIYFALGWLSLLIALDSPLHEIGEQLFWVHMTQHEILMLISAPLLVLGQPLLPFLRALPRSWRKRVASMSRSRMFTTAWATLSAPISAWLLSACALWIWHAPGLFNQTLHNDWIHAAQHTSFLISALLFWWPLARPKPTMGYGAGLAYVFTTALHTSVLGALLTFSPRAWYSPYLTTTPAWSLTPLEDQQLGGLIMWIPAGTLLLIVALVLLVKWMGESQTRLQYTRMGDLDRISNGSAR